MGTASTLGWPPDRAGRVGRMLSEGRVSSSESRPSGLAATWSLTRRLSGEATACQCRKRKRLGLIPGSGRFLEGGNGNPPSVLARNITWMEVSGRLQSMSAKCQT